MQRALKTLEGPSLNNPQLAHTAYFIAQQRDINDLYSVFSVVQALDDDSGRISTEGKLQRLYGTRSEDIFLIRDGERQFLNMDNKLIFNNKQSVAWLMKWYPELGLTDTSAALPAQYLLKCRWEWACPGSNSAVKRGSQAACRCLRSVLPGVTLRLWPRLSLSDGAASIY
ncbi:hypothetical protein [Winslowiella iniecta]|uniref:Uncharacterized protein n=1 Tax=Winslowiella iniecta TaxID=1560201 RepID=A0A0L7TIC8_9GAMM|nr:hypothetical protein [Winslowiella iniecta]KOC95089.1 hypothetical protein NG43_02525 [Winslowiella iniecta]